MGNTVIGVHGVGQTKPGYMEDKWKPAFDPSLNFHIPPDTYVETYWGGVFPPEPPGPVEIATRDLLKTAFAKQVEAYLQSQGWWSRFWTGLTNLFKHGQAAIPNWMLNHEATIEEFVKYLVQPDIRQAVKGQVKMELVKLENSPNTCSIIAHSWGSVVAYESLLDLEGTHSTFRCANLFTLGSPLWLVRDLLQETSGRKPGNVANWVNVHAKGDMVAGNGLKPGFQVDQDDAVPSFGSGDPHDSYFVPGNRLVQQDIIARIILKIGKHGPD